MKQIITSLVLLTSGFFSYGVTPLKIGVSSELTLENVELANNGGFGTLLGSKNFYQAIPYVMNIPSELIPESFEHSPSTRQLSHNAFSSREWGSVFHDHTFLSKIRGNDPDIGPSDHDVTFQSVDIYKGLSKLGFLQPGDFALKTPYDFKIKIISTFSYAYETSSFSGFAGELTSKTCRMGIKQEIEGNIIDINATRALEELDNEINDLITQEIYIFDREEQLDTLNAQKKQIQEGLDFLTQSGILDFTFQYQIPPAALKNHLFITQDSSRVAHGDLFKPELVEAHDIKCKALKEEAQEIIRAM